MATRIIVRLPDELARRFRQRVPARERSAFVQGLLEQALASECDDNDRLYQTALLVEQDEAVSADMAAWGVTVGDGLARLPAFDET